MNTSRLDPPPGLSPPFVCLTVPLHCSLGGCLAVRRPGHHGHPLSPPVTHCHPCHPTQVAAPKGSYISCTRMGDAIFTVPPPHTPAPHRQPPAPLPLIAALHTLAAGTCANLLTRSHSKFQLPLDTRCTSSTWCRHPTLGCRAIGSPSFSLFPRSSARCAHRNHHPCAFLCFLTPQYGVRTVVSNDHGGNGGNPINGTHQKSPQTAPSSAVPGGPPSDQAGRHAAHRQGPQTAQGAGRRRCYDLAATAPCLFLIVFWEGWGCTL